MKTVINNIVLLNAEEKNLAGIRNAKRLFDILAHGQTITDTAG